jgi:AAA15 family ATPase/GTPase
MLIRFTVKNFASFSEEQTLSMVKSRASLLPSHINEDKSGEFQTLRGAVIYGANASGKSNLVDAIHFARNAILDDNKSNKDTSFKLSDETKGQPSSFNFEFKIEGEAFSYGFESQRRIINREWLYKIKRHSDVDTLIFEREKKNGEKANIRFGEIKNNGNTLNDDEKFALKTIAEGTPDNALFLNDAKRRNLKYFIKPLRWFEEKLLIIQTESEQFQLGLEVMLVNDKDFSDFLNKLLQSADTGVHKVEFENFDNKTTKVLSQEILEQIGGSLAEGVSALIVNGSKRILIIKEGGEIKTKRLVTFHKDKSGSDIRFELDEESDGTLRLIEFAPAFFDKNTLDRVLVIDELDRSLHPAITEMFHNAHYNSTERRNSQLILATHEHYLLSQKFYRRDEIWFVEKDKYGQSSLYSLNEYKGKRYNKDVQKDYLLGRYGATPHVREL